MRYFTHIFRRLVAVLFLLLLNTVGRTQSGPPLRLDSLTAQGKTLRGWRWHPGDHPTWASPAFDDHRWDSLPRNASLADVPGLRAAQMGWFRLPLRVGPGLVGQALSLDLNQTGASELYLDGRLLHRLGVVSTDPAREQTRVGGFLLPLYFPDTNRHLLAIRLSFTRSNPYLPIAQNLPLLALRVYKTTDSRDSWADFFRLNAYSYFVQGFLGMIALLHLSLFAFLRERRVNLVFGLAMLSSALYLHLIDFATGITFRAYLGQLLAYGFFLWLAFVLNTASAYLFFRRPLSVLFYALIIGLLAIDLYLTFVPGTGLQGWDLFVIFLLFLDFFRVCFLAWRAGHPAARILLGAIATTLVFYGLTFALGYPGNTQLTFLGVYGMLLSVPVGFSFALARDYALTSRSLQQRLSDVERLSAQTLAQEQEKQDLLARQNETLERQVGERTAELQHSLDTLRTTQTQLIQSEKMASLGELTAGIAHEIQNPLNFVNNFSEVSAELVNELVGELDRGDPDEAKAIAGDLSQNLEKITFHGQRAAAIVRGMLEHSRASTGEKQLTDLNALADEYLRLAYHGLRAKSKEFNAVLKTDFDPTLGKVEVLPQDVGRVLLNLFNNAFYAVAEQARRAQNGYQPTVSVRTKREDGRVEIRVADNGVGMPEAVKAKIFQPFFTTKPAGQGTGLGLSLSYDIVTKGHGGTLTVESSVGTGTEFTLALPNSTYTP